MTAEIAIMNREAVVLAADSAVTLRSGTGAKGSKIFTSANKIFMLSKYRPVGIMVYGNGLFMGLPWETIIKVFRSNLDHAKFDTLRKYVTAFIDYLAKDGKLIPVPVQNTQFAIYIESYFNNVLKKRIDDNIASIISEQNEISEEKIKQVIDDVISAHYDIVIKAKVVSCIKKARITEIKEKNLPMFKKLREKVFEDLPIPNRLLNKLYYIASALAVKEIFPDEVSGVVIAGFGENELFPSIISLTFDGLYNNILKYKEDPKASCTIDFNNAAFIVPFAQHEMVASFMEGVRDDYQNAIEKDLAMILSLYGPLIIEESKKLCLKISDERKFSKSLEGLSNDLLNKYSERLKKYRNAVYVQPIMNIVASLPKDEMAMMAKTLVNLTSFKRRISPDEETVGGPVDVAVITKGDGFIWIERKHYFEREKNLHFCAKYHQEV